MSLPWLHEYFNVYNYCRAVGGILDNLKGIAEDMGSELDRQNKQLDRVNKKADVNTAHLDQANSRIRKQL